MEYLKDRVYLLTYIKLKAKQGTFKIDERDSDGI